MTLQYLIISLIILINFLLQTTIFQYIGIVGIVPNTSLVLTVCFALQKGKKTGPLLGLVMGILQDIFFERAIGVNALLYFLVGYFMGLSEEKLFKDNIMIPIIFTGIATLFYHLIYYFFMFFMGVNVSLAYIMQRVVWLELVYNCIVVIPIFKLIAKIHKKPSISFKRK